MTNKRKDGQDTTIQDTGFSLFKDKPPSDSDDSEESDEDLTDTEDEDSSEYSGLEEESESSSDESEVESLEGESDSSDYQDEVEENTEKSISEADDPSSEISAGKSFNMEDSEAKPPDEYEHDTSDEEDIRNTVGNIPMEWYRDFPHIGYNVEGQRLIKPKHGDELDDFLNKVDDPNYWRTVTNKMTGQNVILTDDDVRLVSRLQKKTLPTGESTTEPWIDFFTYDTMIHPVTNRPEHKRSFVPSKWERLKVGQMVHAIKMGWMKPKAEQTEEEERENYYMLWKDDDENPITKKYRAHIPAPKLPLPGHEESYNPPPEYLLTKDEEEDWNSQEPQERKLSFLPQKYSCLRLVPGYSDFIKERFERCLDLYLCPRQKKMKMNVNPDDLIPDLPKPRDLQPFPTSLSIIYRGHTDIVRSVSVSPCGQWIVSGSDDETVKFWEISTGRCMKTLKVGGAVNCAAWNPSSTVTLVAVTVKEFIILINPHLGDKLLFNNTDEVIQSFSVSAGESLNKVQVDWQISSGIDHDAGIRIKIRHQSNVSKVTWHGKGDYFATVQPKVPSQSVIIHQLSTQKSQSPFKKSKGLVQEVLFHPIRPFFFVASQKCIRVYNLLKQELTKKLLANCKWISCMAVHRGGDNLILGSYDSRLNWFDLDLSSKPYHTLRHHKKALRQVCYHKRYPLFASASDDGTIIVCHGMVYSDLMKNPLIVPVKVLRGHAITKGLGALDCVFHPTQPWIFSSGSDGTVRLFT